MYEFSASKVQGAGFKTGFKSQAAERVLRQFEARRAEPDVGAVRKVQLRNPLRTVALSSVPLSSVLLRPALQVASIEVTRPALLQSRSQFPRSSALSLETPRSVLSKLMPRLKRAASANVFQRLSERLALIKSPSVRLSSVQASSVPVRQRPVSQSVASRLQ
jgi:hypothetical protein